MVAAAQYKQQPKSRKSQFRNRASRALGMDYEEILHAERFNRGTSSGRQRPRRQQANPNAVWVDLTPSEKTAIDDLFAALERSVEWESSYPCDGNTPPLFAEGEQIDVELDGTRYSVRLGKPYLAMGSLGVAATKDRWRYRMHFDDLPEQPSLMITQAQLVRIHIKPLVTFAPTHLLPANVPVAPPAIVEAEGEYKLQGAVFTKPSTWQAAKARLAQNWQRQQRKVQWFETPFIGFAAGQ